MCLNFLAHLHVADHCDSHLAGNLLGDFVKGNPDIQYPRLVAQGIRLHRFVDSYTDSHELIKQTKLLFPSDIRRFSPIALDVYWDYCLVNAWSDYHELSLSEFCLKAEKQTLPACLDSNVHIPTRYQLMVEAMWKGRWIESYKKIENVGLALQKMSSRSLRLAPLADCFETLVAHDSELKFLFRQFYPLVLSNAKVHSDKQKISDF